MRLHASNITKLETLNRELKKKVARKLHSPNEYFPHFRQHTWRLRWEFKKKITIERFRNKFTQQQDTLQLWRGLENNDWWEMRLHASLINAPGASDWENTVAIETKCNNVHLINNQINALDWAYILGIYDFAIFSTPNIAFLVLWLVPPTPPVIS